MAEKIVTNLRIDKDDWLQVRAMAADLGMSTNEYIAHLIQITAVKEMVGLKKEKVKRKRASIWDLAKLAKMPSKPMDLSEEDKIIYGIE